MGWLPEDWKKIILSIEVKEENKDNFFPIGTAFLIDYNSFNILVTVRHIIESENLDKMFISLNTKDNKIIRIPLSELNKEKDVDWFVPIDGDLDIAIILFSVDYDKWDIRKLHMGMFETVDNLNEGDDIFFLGFPLGIKNLDKINPLARAGIIARKGVDGKIVIDSHVFPGNSGSPVFLRPSFVDFTPQGVSIGNIKPPKLIGIVSAYLPYVDPCISLQTRRERIIFEENSGLGFVIPFDYVINLIKSKEFQDYLSKFEITEEVEETKQEEKVEENKEETKKISNIFPTTSSSTYITGSKIL